MADDSVLRKYTSRIGETEGESGILDLDATDDLGCFGWLRGGRDRAVSLVLHKKSGNSLALNYGFVERVEFDPSDGITIVAGRTTVRITGCNLNAEVRSMVRLFDGLTRHRVPWIREVGCADRLEVSVSSGACVVEMMEW